MRTWESKRARAAVTSVHFGGIIALSIQNIPATAQAVLSQTPSMGFHKICLRARKVACAGLYFEVLTGCLITWTVSINCQSGCVGLLTRTWTKVSACNK